MKGLKELKKKLAYSEAIDSSRMGIVEKFPKNFPLLLQLIFFYLPLGDLKALVLVCKRWNVGERSKL